MKMIWKKPKRRYENYVNVCNSNRNNSSKIINLKNFSMVHLLVKIKKKSNNINKEI